MLVGFVLNDLALCATSTSRAQTLFTGTCKNPQVLQFLRNAVWHYRELYSRATEEPVKDMAGKLEDCGVTYSHW